MNSGVPSVITRTLVCILCDLISTLCESEQKITRHQMQKIQMK